MKTLLATLLLLAMSPLVHASFESESNTSAGLEYLLGATEKSTNIDVETNSYYASCSAWTKCCDENSRSCWKIKCKVSGYKCQAEYEPGEYVHCQAWDNHGSTIKNVKKYCHPSR